jgi:hypothetical protein
LGEEVLCAGIMAYPVLPVGGAVKNLKEIDYIKYHIGETCLNCSYEGNLVVKYDGKIYPCCNQCVVQTALAVGDYKEDNYQQTLYNIKNNGLLFLLRTEGLFPFIEYARTKLNIVLPNKIVSSCELCKLFFSKENINKFAPFVREKINFITKQYIK